MPNYCVVFGCHPKGKIEGITYHMFPTKNEDQRRKWIQAVNRKDWEPNKHSRICSLHFREADMDRTSLSCVRIREGAVPTIFAGRPFESEVKEYESSKINVQLESDSSVESSSRRLKIELSKREVDLKITRHKVKILQQTKRRQNKRLAKLQDVIKSLKTKMIYEDEECRKYFMNEECEDPLPKKRKRARKVLDTGADERNSVTCCALACTNTSESHVLTRLPSDPERRDQWISRINREDWTPTKDSALCQIHFEADAWKENDLGEKVLKDDVLPTLNLHGEGIRSWITLDKSGSVKDERVRNSSDDEENDDDEESSVYIKQEALEPDITLEGTSGIKDPFETVYLDPNIEKLDDNLIKNSSIKVEQLDKPQEETIVPEILPESIKAEPLDIIEEPEQTFTSLSCLACSQDFEEKWELELHVREKHSKSDSTPEFTNKLDYSSSSLIESMKKLVQRKLKVGDPASQTSSPNLKKPLKKPRLKRIRATTSSSSTSNQVEGTTQSESPLVPTSQSVPTVTGQDTCSVTSQGGEDIKFKQFVALFPDTAVKKPVAGTSSAVALSPPPPPTPSTSMTAYTIDSSDSFTISLAQFPESLRVGIKRKMLEVVEIVTKFKAVPEMIVIGIKTTNPH